jgi:hypothetical protein
MIAVATNTDCRYNTRTLLAANFIDVTVRNAIQFTFPAKVSFDGHSKF